MAQHRPYLKAAVDASRWIRASELRTGAGITWPSDPRDPKSVNRALYSGSPGVVLFQLELHHATAESEYLQTAKAGADELIARLGDDKQTGLYTGIAGIGFTLGEVHRATGDPKYRDAMAAVVGTLKARAVTTGAGVQWSEVTDIIGGAAGTGLFLLHAGRYLQDPDARRLASRAADRLIEVAIPEHGGLKWHMEPKFARLMPNFSHGTAGIAYFLARVYEETGERKYLDASLAGAKYLQAIAKTEGGICLVQHNQPHGLELYYLGWCHGPVGTARLWRQLASITGDQAWDAWVDRSARGVLESGIPEKLTEGFWNNVSQCCGSAGVGQFFLDLHRTRANPGYLAFAKRMTEDLLKRGTRDEQGLRWVQAEHRVQPKLLVAQTGYMQGAAGIGMWLLRLDAAEHGRQNFVRFPDTPF
ncbi:MAG TPA: lanthionine synthetase LanC family protein [Vicinamibacterales bacterium]|nr:lanthionine synthetase LanC family protein [Vicinamibacterales bacterium]